ncbi:transposase family protein [Streptomyces sp. NPDC059928]|uniref:transposase family protein n=1 Tax=unclassified Streptomyces TaxID=2593676 RepID=UPI00364FCF2B
MDRSTVSGAIRAVRPLPAAHGFAVPDRSGVRLRTLENLFAYADARALTCASTAPKCRSAAPAPTPRPQGFVSGKKKQNTIKTTTFSDPQGRTLFSGVVRPGRMHDQTAARTEGIAERLRTICRH